MIKYENMSTLKIILNKYDILHKDIQNLVNSFDTIKLKKNKLHKYWSNSKTNFGELYNKFVFVKLGFETNNTLKSLYIIA